MSFYQTPAKKKPSCIFKSRVTHSCEECEQQIWASGLSGYETRKSAHKSDEDLDGIFDEFFLPFFFLKVLVRNWNLNLPVKFMSSSGFRTRRY